MSYLWARIRPPKDQDHARGLDRRPASAGASTAHFFKTYNEKLWGVPVDKLPADFAAQRIKNLSFMNAVMNALMPKRNQKEITSLIEEFQYPKHGPGMMWERCRDLVEARGCKVADGAAGRRRSATRDGRAVAVDRRRTRPTARARSTRATT